MAKPARHTLATILGMWNLSFDDLSLFARVAALGSLSAVARERDGPVSQVSRALSRMEKVCGARLVHRSTHGLALTAEGQTLADYCRRIMDTLDQLEGEFGHRGREASGWVRVATSTVVANYLLVPSLEGLHARHPALCIDLKVDDRMVDMAREGIDIAIRTGPPSSDTVVARRIGTLGRRLYATPAYLRHAGTPQLPDDLGRHRLIGNGGVAQLNHWPFIVKGQPRVFVAEGYLRADTSGVTAQMALQGLGIARLSTLVAEPLVQRGELAPVLPELVDEQPIPVYAVTLSGRHRLPKIQACIDYWAQCFGQPGMAATPTAT